jgi:hypothetical protein
MIASITRPRPMDDMDVSWLYHTTRRLKDTGATFDWRNAGRVDAPSAGTCVASGTISNATRSQRAGSARWRIERERSSLCPQVHKCYYTVWCRSIHFSDLRNQLDDGVLPGLPRFLSHMEMMAPLDRQKHIWLTFVYLTLEHSA